MHGQLHARCPLRLVRWARSVPRPAQSHSGCIAGRGGRARPARVAVGRGGTRNLRRGSRLRRHGACLPYSDTLRDGLSWTGHTFRLSSAVLVVHAAAAAEAEHARRDLHPRAPALVACRTRERWCKQEEQERGGGRARGRGWEAREGDALTFLDQQAPTDRAHARWLCTRARRSRW